MRRVSARRSRRLDGGERLLIKHTGRLSCWSVPIRWVFLETGDLWQDQQGVKLGDSPADVETKLAGCARVRCEESAWRAEEASHSSGRGPAVEA